MPPRSPATAWPGGWCSHTNGRIVDELPSRLELVNRGFDFQAAELAAARARLTDKARSGDPGARIELARIKARQRGITAVRARRLAELKSEPECVRPSEIEFLVHALVVPAQDQEEIEHFDAEVETVAMGVAASWEERLGAKVKDVSRPDLARRAGLSNWPGFDLLSLHPRNERRAIEVKGRAGSGSVEMRENEWGQGMQPPQWLLALCCLRLRDAPPAPSPSARPLWQADRPRSRVVYLHHISGRVDGGSGRLRNSQDGRN